MVKKKEKAAEAAPAGWGSAPQGEAANISTDPENRQPPLDDGWDENTPPSPMAMPAADPAPVKATKRGKAGSAASDDVPLTPKAKGGNSDGLLDFVERLERLAEERATITEDMKEVVAEAKTNGYDAAVLKKVIARRKRGREAVLEEETLIDAYQNVVGWND